MAINRVDYPTVPNPVSGDWAKAIELIEKAMQNINNPIQVDGSNIPEGATFQIGGVVYYTDSDTAITGTGSDYVKLTPNAGDSGATCDATYIANLTGITWNKIRNGYYDISGNLVIFDEVKAILASALVGGNSKFAELFNTAFNQSLKTTDSPTFANATIAEHNVDTQLDRVNQDVKTTASPTFNVLNAGTVNTGNGATEIYDMNQDVRSDDSVSFVNITASGYIIADSKRITSANYLHGTYLYSVIFTKLSSLIPSNGNALVLNGGIRTSAVSYDIGILSRAERISSTTIRFYYFDTLTETVKTKDVVSTDTIVSAYVSISW